MKDINCLVLFTEEFKGRDLDPFSKFLILVEYIGVRSGPPTSRLTHTFSCLKLNSSLSYIAESKNFILHTYVSGFYLNKKITVLFRDPLFISLRFINIKRIKY